MNILEYLNITPKYQKILKELTKDFTNIQIDNASKNASKALICKMYQENPQNIVVVYPNIYYANIAYEDYIELMGADKISFFPVEEFITLDLVSSSNAYRLERMKTLISILNNEPKIIITNTEGYIHSVMSKERLNNSFFSIKTGDIIRMDKLVDMLVTRGYKKSPTTEVEGTFSVRGSIIDVFVVGSTSPYRFDFFDDEIEKIKTFDVDTQLSTGVLSKVDIYPIYEIQYEKDQIPLIKENILKQNELSDRIKKDLIALEEYESLDNLYIYLPYIDANYQPFISLINNPVIVFNEFNEIKEKEKQNSFELSSYLEQSKFVGVFDFFETINTILPISVKNIFISEFQSNIDEIEIDKHINLATSNNIDYNNNIKNLIDDIKINKNKTYLITHFDDYKLLFFKDTFDNAKIEYKEIKDIKELKKHQVNVCVSKNALGFIDYEENIEVLTPHEFSKGKVSRNKKLQKVYNESQKIYHKDELQIGDYVVHQDYGIGKYLGIKTIELENVKNDYIQIEFDKESKLYIPVENIYVLEKYLGSGDKIPKLSKAGGKEWQKKREKIKEKVREVAKKLIAVQAKRELLQGFKYPKDSSLQEEFEREFPYKETKGQLEAINAVKKDMESSRPVDRLICGDVGFGKTEVAMRAAFKAIDNSKQVAYLVPTTVLARQHYLSFKERFEKYGARVELLSRFVDHQGTKNVINGLNTGYVDIVVGTHRLLSNDVKFKDLGLLIIDEEHRFGVEHKEKIKELKADVDVLSLSATPIPRTLQMSLSGLRDLSLIETPPIDRLSVQTYVLESNDSVIREAIRRELGRRGQVFYLMNRISELDSIKRKINRLVPEAKVTIIHGGMEKDEIEDALNLFLDKTYDVLVCTTVIETGIDIPNANTIIIERADTLGLAQIYQIRGRVGRSDRNAYAYLMYDKNKVLTETGKKRLDTIKEFTALGSGYKIAMRDLSIRGAGDILGSEQSGFIDDIGINLYMKLLNEAIEEEKGIIKKQETEKIVDLKISKHIDEKYIYDDEIRIAMHQEINKIKTREEATKIINEFNDRYGRTSHELKIYVEGKYLNHLLKTKGIESYNVKKDAVYFNFDKEKTLHIPYNHIKAASIGVPDYKFKYVNDRICVEIPLTNKNNQQNEEHYIYNLTKFLENF